MAREKTGGNFVGLPSNLEDAYKPWLEKAQVFDVLDKAQVTPIARLYRNNFHTAQRINRVWMELWRVWGERIETPIQFRPMHFSGRQIKEIEDEGRMLIYVPEELSGDESLPILSGILPPQFVNHWTERNIGTGKGQQTYTNLIDQHGWLSVETNHLMPNRSNATDESQLDAAEKRRLLVTGELSGLTVNSYVIATAFSKLMTDSFLDTDMNQAGPALLLGTRMRHGSEKGFYVVYGSAEITSALRDGRKQPDEFLNRINLWSWGGEIEYAAVRTAQVEIKRVRDTRTRKTNPDKAPKEVEPRRKERVVAKVEVTTEYEVVEEIPDEIKGLLVRNPGGQIFEILDRKVIDGQPYIQGRIIGQPEISQSTSMFPAKFLGDRYQIVKPKK